MKAAIMKLGQVRARAKHNAIKRNAYIYKYRAFIVVLMSLIFAFMSMFYLHLSWNKYQKIASSEAILLAESMESLMHPEHIAELTGDAEDLLKPDYIMTKLSLIRLIEAGSSIRFAYIFGERDGDMVFLMDSEVPESPDYSPPGQVYSEANDVDWSPFRTGNTVLTEPTTDRWGTWISALVPIKDLTNGNVIAVLGLDYDASEWQLGIWKKMTSDIIIIICSLILYTALIIMIVQQIKIRGIEKLYHAVFDQAPIGIAIMNNASHSIRPEFGNMNMNQMYEKILGRTKSDLIKIKWTDITHPDDLHDDLTKFEQFKADLIEGYSLEKRFIKDDGTNVWTHMKIASLDHFSHDNTMHLCLLEDITNRKEIEESLKESERSKTNFLSHLPGLAYRCYVDDDWTMQFVSDGCYELTGYTPDSLVNNKTISYNELICPEYREIVRELWHEAIYNHEKFNYEYEIITSTGERKWVLEIGEGVYTDSCEVKTLEGIVLDITSRKINEEQLKQLLKRTQSMISNHEAVMLLVDPISGKIIEANKAATDFYGYTNEELLNMIIQDINTMNKEDIEELLKKSLNKGQKYFTFPHKMKNGDIKIVDVYSCPIEYDNKKILFLIIFDVTIREEIAKHNEYMAHHDHLTGLFNRRYFDQEFERRVNQNEFPITFLLGDINGFKAYNDAFGHIEGDKVLSETAKAIMGIINNQDIPARFGGDEFAILVSGKEEADIKQYLYTLEREFDSWFKESGEGNLITISWGYGIQRKREDTIDVLQAEAEAYMYNRKYYSNKSRKSKTVDVIMETLFTKSEREKKHSERVSILSEAIAKKMHLEKTEVDKIRVAGLLHDIGKIGIDEAVLNKEGKLDSKEWELMKLHSAKGAGILTNTMEYHDISDIVLSHHERYDGLGYPNGIAGEDIPLGARIIAIADSYDAMTNERPYRKAMNNEAAIAEISKCSGTQLDPEIALIFTNEVVRIASVKI